MARWRSLNRRASRRQVLLGMAGLGAAAVVSPLANECEPGGLKLSRVAFVRTTNRAEGVRQALGLLMPPSVRGKTLLLKPNLNSADMAPAATHLDTLRALAEWLLGKEAAHIVVGDRSGIGPTRDVMDTIGVTSLAEELGMEIAPFDEFGPDEWTAVRPQGGHWVDGFRIPNLLKTVDAVVQTCNLKTHGYGGHFTMSLKNSVGMVARSITGQSHNYMSELHNSQYQREMIAEINTAFAPAFVVLDGVEAFTTGGPVQGTQVATEVIMASTDRVALDAVGVAILRYWGTTPEVSEGTIFGQAQIARAVALGLGVSSPTEIEFVTSDQASKEYADEIRGVLSAG